MFSGDAGDDMEAVARFLGTFDACAAKGELNQDQFQEMYEQTGAMNTSWGARLFAAMDADNTGSMDAFELLEGLRAMAGLSGRLPAPDFDFNDFKPVQARR